MVSIAGGEPLLHPEIDKIVARPWSTARSTSTCAPTPCCCSGGSTASRPSHYFSWVVHMDGLGERHDAAVDREGVFDKVVAAVREAKARGFRVTTNSTFFNTDSPKTVRDVLDFLNDDLERRRHDDLARPTPTRRRPTRSTSWGSSRPGPSSPRPSPDKRREAGGSTTRRSSSTSWRARSSSTAPPGGSRATRCSAGSGPATSWPTATRRATRSWSRRPTGRSTAGARTPVAPTAWPTAGTSRRRSSPRWRVAAPVLRALVNTH